MEMLSLSLLIPRGLARSSPLSWQGAHCIPALLQPMIFCPPYGQSLLGTWAGVVVPWGRVFFCLRMVLCLCSNSNLALRSPSHNLFLSHPTSLGPLSPLSSPQPASATSAHSHLLLQHLPCGQFPNASALGRHLPALPPSLVTTGQVCYFWGWPKHTFLLIYDCNVGSLLYLLCSRRWSFFWSD